MLVGAASRSREWPRYSNAIIAIGVGALQSVPVLAAGGAVLVDRVARLEPAAMAHRRVPLESLGAPGAPDDVCACRRTRRARVLHEAVSSATRPLCPHVHCSVLHCSPIQRPLRRSQVFPAMEDVRHSLEGYAAGGSIPYAEATDAKQLWLRSFMQYEYAVVCRCRCTCTLTRLLFTLTIDHSH